MLRQTACHSKFLSLRYLSNIRETSELLSGYTDAPPARPRGVATLKINYKGQFNYVDFYIVNYEASVIIGLPTCIKLNLIKRIDYVSSGIPSNNADSALLMEFADMFQEQANFRVSTTLLSIHQHNLSSTLLVALHWQCSRSSNNY